MCIISLYYIGYVSNFGCNLIILLHVSRASLLRLHLTASNIQLFLSGDKQLDGYQKKKYVCKLLFIFLLGHDIDFGHMEAVNLLSSNKYTEKQIVSIPGVRKCILNRSSHDCNNKYVCSANALKSK